MSIYEILQKNLKKEPRRWLITGVAGFIGSNLLETLLNLDQEVLGLDNFSTGYRHNLEEVRTSVSQASWNRFRFIEGDIIDLETCLSACQGVELILHQAALGSVPRSIEDPIRTNASNVTGFLNMMVAAKETQVRRFVYAASSSTYGDHPGLPKVEETIGKPLSPYAVTKYVNELYADVFGRSYGVSSIGLRYFNVFGKRQDPSGAYAAVIPVWFRSLIQGTPLYINGDGQTSRDFCYIENCVQANLLAAATENRAALNQVYNVAFGEQTTLNDLFFHIQKRVASHYPQAASVAPRYREFRTGDVRHSLADIGKIKRLLEYAPGYSVAQGLDEAARWYRENLK